MGFIQTTNFFRSCLTSLMLESHQFARTLPRMNLRPQLPARMRPQKLTITDILRHRQNLSKLLINHFSNCHHFVKEKLLSLFCFLLRLQCTLEAEGQENTLESCSR